MFPRNCLTLRNTLSTKTIIYMIYFLAKHPPPPPPYTNTPLHRSLARVSIVYDTIGLIISCLHVSIDRAGCVWPRDSLSLCVTQWERYTTDERHGFMCRTIVGGESRQNPPFYLFFIFLFLLFKTGTTSFFYSPCFLSEGDCGQSPLPVWKSGFRRIWTTFDSKRENFNLFMFNYVAL